MCCITHFEANMCLSVVNVYLIPFIIKSQVKSLKNLS